MKFSYIRDYGRYTNPATGRAVNVKQGRWMQRGTDHKFYIYRGKRVLISDAEFSTDWKVAS